MTCRILVKILRNPGYGAQELGILPGAGVQNKNQEPELSLKLRTGAGAMAI